MEGKVYWDTDTKPSLKEIDHRHTERKHRIDTYHRDPPMKSIRQSGLSLGVSKDGFVMVRLFHFLKELSWAALPALVNQCGGTFLRLVVVALLLL